MLEKEKLWLAVYINIGGIAREDVGEYLYDIISSMKFDGSVRTIAVPIEDGENRVECIYDPTGNSSEKYQEFFEKANRYIDKLEKEITNKEKNKI